MRYLSLFSGIEAATVAWEPLGWEPVAFVENDPFCCAVLKHHYPNVPNLGDITKVNFRRYRGKVDVIVGGSPCQSFSIAGNREGLAGESGLMFEYIRAVREARPRVFLWENVKGAFNVEHGEAFRQLLSEMDKLGYGLAWRVLDAQFFGLAQRRERVFVVGSLGDMRSADVLFEPESMRGDTETSREKRETLAGHAQGGVGGDDSSGQDCLTPWDAQSKRCYSVSGVAPTLQSGTSEGMRIQPTVAFAQNQRDELRTMDVSGALSSNPGMKQQSYICMESNQHKAVVLDNGISTTLNSLHEQPIICMDDDYGKGAVEDDMCGSLKCGGGEP